MGKDEGIRTVHGVVDVAHSINQAVKEMVMMVQHMLTKQ